MILYFNKLIFTSKKGLLSVIIEGIIVCVCVFIYFIIYLFSIYIC